MTSSKLRIGLPALLARLMSTPLPSADAVQRRLMVMLASLLAARIIAVFTFPLADTTEARYAEIARKMVETGDWITPQFAYGVPFWGKPPLHTWLSAGGMTLFGAGEFGARILILATAIGVLWLTWAWTRSMSGQTVALLATTVLASSGLFFVASALVMTDMPMALGTTLSMVAFFKAVTDERHRPGWGYAFFAGIAIGLMAKGPVAAVVTGIPIGLWVLPGGRWKLLTRLPWISGTALVAVLVVPWYIAAELKTPGFLHYFLVGEHFERFIVPEWQGDLYGSGHAEPKGMIWLFFAFTFLPWTLFAVPLLTRGRRVIAAFGADRIHLRSYLLVWSIAPMLLFTPAANILTAYVLPGLPAAAILLVVVWSDLSVSAQPSWTSRRIFYLSAGLAPALVLCLCIVALLAPGARGLKSDKALAAAVEAIAPSGSLHYWKKRTYSGEFYTAGRATRIDDLAVVEGMAGNGRRDFIAIAPENISQLQPLLRTRYRRVGTYGRFTLFVEPAEVEA